MKKYMKNVVKDVVKSVVAGNGSEASKVLKTNSYSLLNVSPRFF